MRSQSSTNPTSATNVTIASAIIPSATNTSTSYQVPREHFISRAAELARCRVPAAAVTPSLS
jgi:hypothetical protein